MEGLRVKTRMQWMDALRGIAIILVIIWHAVSLTDKEDLSVPDWLIQANYFFMPFRMPTLMFLSGLLVTSSLRKSTFQYYEGKLRLLIWPYFIWASVYILLVGSDYPIYHPRAWFAVGHLWFLFFIAAYYLIAPLIKKVPVWVTPIALLLASIPIDGSDDGAVKKFLYFGAFFFLGRAATANQGSFERILLSRWMPAALLVATGFGIYAMFMSVEFRGQYAPLNVAGIFVCIWLVKKVEGHSMTTPLKYIGRNSLIFYVSHVPVITILLFGAHSAGIRAPAVLITVSIATALLAGHLLTRVGNTIHGRWLFEMPQIPGAWRRKRPPEHPRGTPLDRI